MNSCKKYKLGELAEIKGGKRLPKGVAFVDYKTTHPYIRVTDMGNKIVNESGLLFIDEKSHALISRYIVNAEDIILSIVGTIGSVSQIDKRLDGANLTENCVKIKPLNDQLDNDFLYYYLISQSGQSEIIKKTVGSTQPKLPLYNIKDINLLLPSRLMQTRIASILSALDDKIELNRRMNQTLEQVAQTFFYEYCWQGESVKLIELIEFNPKLSFKIGQFGTYVEMGNLPIRGLSIENSIIRRFNGGSKFQNGDTLFARITPCLENGKTAFVDVLDKREIGFGSTEFIVLRAKESISSYFPYMIARDKNFREHAIKSMVGTSGRQRVQTEMLLSFEVPKCKNEQMNAFHEFADPIFLKIKANTKEIKTLSTIRDTLLPKLVSGELDVSALVKEEMIKEDYVTESILNA